VSKATVFEVVKEVIAEVLPDVSPDHISIGQNLKALGANSIERTEIVVLSMEKLGVNVSLMSFGGVENIEGMVDVLVANA